MPLNIPVPKTFMQSFLDTQQGQEKNRLMQAQAQQAKGAAAKNNMLAQLMDIAYGPDETSGQNINTTQTSNGNQSVNSISENSGIGSSAIQPQISNRRALAKQRLLELGFLHETPDQQESREKRTAYAKALGTADVDTMKDWNKTITASHEVMPNLENIQDISANPVFQNMYKNPEYFGKDISVLKRFGKPEEQDLLARMGTNIKDVYTSTARDFKGAFREFEKKLFDSALPDAERDTLHALIAKNNTVMALRQVVSKRLSLAENIVRSSGGSISPNNALDIADKQIGTKQVVKQIEDQFKRSQKEQKAAYEKSTQNVSGGVSFPPKGSEVQILDAKGNVVGWSSKANAEKFIIDHPGYSHKELTNG